MFVPSYLLSSFVALMDCPQFCMRQRCLCTCTLSSRVSHNGIITGTRVTAWPHNSQPSLLDLRANFVTLPEFVTEVPEPLKRSTLELASSHLVCSVALTGVLALQAGRWWAENNNDPDN